MADKASGVYVRITDSSYIFDTGTVVMNAIVPMKLIKGDTLNTVTGDNFEDVIGYKLAYNPNYYGLKEMLSQVASLTVWRVNTYGGKILWTSGMVSGSNYDTDTSQYGTFEELVNHYSSSAGGVTTVSKDILIGSKTTGDWDNLYVRITYDSTTGNYTMTFAHQSGSDYIPVNSYTFSMTSTDDNYWENVDFGDFYVRIQNLASGSNILSKWGQLKNGVTGTVPATLDTSVLEGAGYNFCFMNGLGADDVTYDKAAISTIATACKDNKIHCFIDAKAVATNGTVTTSGVVDWVNAITALNNNEYAVIGARPDQVEVNGSTIYVYPSVNYCRIYANMGNSYDSYNYPPAGVSYGSIVTNNLAVCDFEKGSNPTTLKTNRINWQRVTNSGSVMWEQRTKYGQNTDLSYIAPTFIVDAIVKELVAFEENFNFRYMTRTDLLNQDSGLKTILDAYVNAGFLYSYSFSIPSYDEAQKAGRTLTIRVQIVVMKDSEVINLEVELTNA